MREAVFPFTPSCMLKFLAVIWNQGTAEPRYIMDILNQLRQYLASDVNIGLDTHTYIYTVETESSGDPQIRPMH